MSPTQGVLYLLVALLDPAAQSVEAGNLRHVRWGEIAVCGTAFGLRSRQVGEQVKGREIRQRGGVSGGDHRPPLPSCFERPASEFQCPPRLYVSIAEVVLQSDPLSRIVLSLPRVLPDRIPHLFSATSGRKVPTVRRLHGQHIGYPSALQSPSELAMLSVENVPDNRPEREIHLYGPLDQLKGYLWLVRNSGSSLPPSKWWAGV